MKHLILFLAVLVQLGFQAVGQSSWEAYWRTHPAVVVDTIVPEPQKVFAAGQTSWEFQLPAGEIARPIVTTTLFVYDGDPVRITQQPYIEPRPATYDLAQSMPEHVIKVYVTKVYDGDSFRAKGEDGVIRKYRLLGIDAPETGHNAYVSARQPFSVESRDALRSRILKQWVYIDTRPYRRLTRTFDRILVDVYDMTDSTLINGWMVENGYAWNIPVPARRQASIGEAMLQAGEAARVMKLGLHNGPNVKPETWRKNNPGHWIVNQRQAKG